MIQGHTFPMCESVIVARKGRFESIGDLALLDATARRTAHVIATTPLRCLVLRRPVYAHLLDLDRPARPFSAASASWPSACLFWASAAFGPSAPQHLWRLGRAS